MRHCPFSHTSTMMRARILKKYMYDESYQTSEDYSLFIDLIKNHKAANLDDILVTVPRLRDGETFSRNTWQILKTQYRLKWKAYTELNLPMWQVTYFLLPMIQALVPKNIIEQYVDWKLKS